MTHVNQDNSASRPDNGRYAQVIAGIAQEGVCPFCPEHLKKYHKPAIEERAHWIVTDNMYPYKPSLHHRLLIHKGHISHFSELSPEAWMELHEIAQTEMKRLSISGGTFVMRFGDARYTGASVSHLHAHIVQSDPADASYDRAKGLVMRIG